MMEVDPGDADAIRSLADKIERGTLTDDERSRSTSVLGRAASADVLLGRALGVRYTDVPRVRGKLVYRLTALDADGSPGSAMESAEVDPAKPTPAPGRPAGLRAEEQAGGVALFWADPPASPVAPVVAYRVDRGVGGRRMAALNGKPLFLDRHLRRGKPEFLDGGAPAKKLTYEVRSIDVFGRLSAPVRVEIAVKNVARAEGPPGAEATASKAAAPEATPAPSPRIASAPSEPSAKAPAEASGKVVWTAAKGEPTGRQAGPPPPPVIVGIAGMGDRVVVRFRPGEPADLTQAFLVLRSQSPTETGVAIGRPLPGDAREWQDTTVSAGQFFWYRLVAVDGAGNRSEPSKPKWVSTGSR